MINITKTEVLEILKTMGGVLVGSRSIGMHSDASDYDIVFVSEANYNVAKMLIAKVHTTSYEEVVERTVMIEETVYIYHGTKKRYKPKTEYTIEQKVVEGDGGFDIILHDQVWSKEEQVRKHLHKYPAKARERALKLFQEENDEKIVNSFLS